MSSNKKQIQVQFLEDLEPAKKGQIFYMDSKVAEEYQKEGFVKIIKEDNREKEAKFYRDKHIIETLKGIDKVELLDKPDLESLNLSQESIKRIKSETDPKEKLIKKYLKKKSIFEQITEKELDKQIVGEYDTRKVIFLAACGRLVENAQIASYNLMVNSSAGAGKDYVVGKVLSIIPLEQYIKKTRITKMAFTYWHNAQFEPEWTWDGKVFYLEDISEEILNHEVFKVMSSSGSSATIVIKQKAYEIDVKGKPVLIITTATAIPTPEITRRFEFCNLDEGINQTIEIMKRHANFAKKGVNPKLNPEITEALSLLKPVKVRIPFADKLPKYFPGDNIIMRTKFVRFLDFIKASAAFHQFQRTQDSENFILAAKKDYEIAKKVLKKLTTNQFLIPLTLNQQKIIQFFTENPSFSGYVSQISNKIGGILALNNLQNNLNLLVSYGLLNKNTSKDISNRDVDTYFLSTLLQNSSHLFDLPSYEVIVGKTGQKKVVKND